MAGPSQPVVWGRASWPGATSCQSCTYTVSHGISPGVAVFYMNPQLNEDGSPALPAMFGDLTLFDGIYTITIPQCKLDNIQVEQDDQGFVWILTILDRRWRWINQGYVNGWFNQLDPHGKLIPWTIRSPQELAEICLKQMDEEDYIINLPPGLAQAVGEEYVEMLSTGINFPPTGTNPAINWEAVPPAQALQQLVELFGRRVIYQLSTDSILIDMPGVGGPLPAGFSLHKETPSLRVPAAPDSVGVRGDDTRYQMRLRLGAVGEDWDGIIRPINDLSYAPLLDGAVQLTDLYIEVADGGLGNTVTFTVEINGTPYSAVGNEGDDAEDVANAVMSALNAVPNAPYAATLLSPDPEVSIVRLTGTQQGTSFRVGTEIQAVDADEDVSFYPDQVQAAVEETRSWQYCDPPDFEDVQPVENKLTYEQARALAQKCVWKMYQVVDLDVSGEGLIKIPSWPETRDPNTITGVETDTLDKIPIRYYLELLDTKVEQIVPQPADQNIFSTENSEEPLILDYYNGYSKDQPARVYGEVSQECFQLGSSLAYVGQFEEPLNTPPNGIVPIPFRIDKTYQLVIFDSHVYFDSDGESYQEPDLILEIACHVRNPITGQKEAYLKVVPVPPSITTENPVIKSCPDVQLNVIGVYEPITDPDTEETIGWDLVDWELLEDDAILRADYYLAGMLAQYNFSGGQIREYNGLFWPIDLDGFIQQVTWTVGKECYTIASANCEHHPYVSPYPARRRAENLPGVLGVIDNYRRDDLPGS